MSDTALQLQLDAQRRHTRSADMQVRRLQAEQVADAAQRRLPEHVKRQAVQMRIEKRDHFDVDDA